MSSSKENRNLTVVIKKKLDVLDETPKKSSCEPQTFAPTTQEPPKNPTKESSNTPALNDDDNTVLQKQRATAPRSFERPLGTFTMGNPGPKQQGVAATYAPNDDGIEKTKKQQHRSSSPGMEEHEAFDTVWGDDDEDPDLSPPPGPLPPMSLPLGSTDFTRTTTTAAVAPPDEEAPTGVIPVAQAVKPNENENKGILSWWGDIKKRTLFFILLTTVLLAALIGVSVGLSRDDDDSNNDKAVVPEEAPKLPGNWTQVGQDIEGIKKPEIFGKAISLSKDGLVLAAGADDSTNSGGIFAGQVRVFQFLEDTWIQLGGDIDGEMEDDSTGISTAVNGDGTVVAVGAYRHSPPGVDCCGAGRVRVFGLVFGEWVQLGQSLDGEAKADRFGSSCALSEDGKIVAIGAQNNDVQGDRKNAGHVRVFEFVGGNWTQIGQDIDGLEPNDKSGDRRVRLSDDGRLLVVGANRHDGNGNDAGHVRVFERVENEWIQLGESIDGEREGDRFGAAFDISGDGSVLAVGASVNDGVNGENSGHVRTFYLSQESGNWVQFGIDLDGEAPNDDFGRDVAINYDGTVLAVGARYNAQAAVDAGHVRIFRWVNGEWIQVGDDIDGDVRDGHFGTSVDISGDGTIVASGQPGFNNARGKVRVFQLEE